QLEQELNPPHPTATRPPVEITTNLVNQRPAPTNLNRAASPPKMATNNAKPPATVAQPLPSNADVVKVSPAPIVKPPQHTSPPPPPVTQSPASLNDSTESAPSANRAQAERLFAEGRRAQQAHRLAEAINSYGAAIQQDPTYFEACYNLASANAEAGDLPGAITAYESALAIRPASLDPPHHPPPLPQHKNPPPPPPPHPHHPPA